MNPAARRQALLAAEARARSLFARIETLDLVRSGRLESAINKDIHALAAQEFGTTTHWHKRIVRAGPNTVCPYDEDPPDRLVKDDDIAFVDLGPVFDAWEADFGRTYVIGSDPIKQRIVADGADCWQIAAAHAGDTDGITAEELFTFVEELAGGRGWRLGQWHSGHLVGDFPHERPPEKVHNFVMPGNRRPLRSVDARGRPLEWILEIHFVDPERGIGSFFEQLLPL